MKRTTIAASLAASLLLGACGASHHSAADLASAPDGTTSTARSDNLGQPAHTGTAAQASPGQAQAQTQTQTQPELKASTTQTVAAVHGTTLTVTNPKSSTTHTSTAAKVSATHTSTAAPATTLTSTDADKPTTQTSTNAAPPQTATATSTVAASTTPDYTTVNSTTPVGSPNADPPPSTGRAPVPTGADPTGANSPMDCLTAAGLDGAHMWESGSWEATDSTDHKSVYINGPFASHQAAVTDGDSLTPVEYVIAAGDYVVQTVLTNPSPDVLTPVAKCLEG